MEPEEIQLVAQSLWEVIDGVLQHAIARTQWRPIASAPKDGTAIECQYPGRDRFARWHVYDNGIDALAGGEGCWEAVDYNVGTALFPAVWRPANAEWNERPTTEGDSHGETEDEATR